MPLSVPDRDFITRNRSWKVHATQRTTSAVVGISVRVEPLFLEGQGAALFSETTFESSFAVVSQRFTAAWTISKPLDYF